MQQRAVKLQEDENQTAALATYNNFHREMLDVQYNNEDAFHRLEGRAAYDGVKSQTKKLDELQRKYVEELNTKRARDLFGESARRLVDSEVTNMSRKGLEGLKSWKKQTYDAGIVRAFESAAVHFNNPEAIGAEVSNVASFVAKQAELNGWSADVTAVMLEQQTSALHKSVIMARMQIDPTGAQEYEQQPRITRMPKQRVGTFPDHAVVLANPDLKSEETPQGADRPNPEPHAH